MKCDQIFTLMLLENVVPVNYFSDLISLTSILN